MKDFIQDKIVDLWPLHLIVTLPIVVNVICAVTTGKLLPELLGL